MIARSEYTGPVGRQVGGVAVDPAHPLTAHARAGDREHPRRGIDTGERVAGARERARDQAGAAPEVHDRACAELGRELQAEVRLRVRLRTR